MAVLGRSQFGFKLRNHFATTVAHLLPSCITAVAFVFSLFTFPLSMRLYNNAAQIFGAKEVLRRRLEILEGKIVYTTRGMCSIYRASRVSVFFLKKVFARRRLCRRLCRKWNNKKSLWVAIGGGKHTILSKSAAKVVYQAAKTCQYVKKNALFLRKSAFF